MADEQNWMEQRNRLREAGGTDPQGEDRGAEPLANPRSDERPMGQNTDDRQIGQYGDHGSPPNMQK